MLAVSRAPGSADGSTHWLPLVTGAPSALHGLPPLSAEYLQRRLPRVGRAMPELRSRAAAAQAYAAFALRELALPRCP